MVPYTVVCEACGKDRVGRFTGDEVRPFRDECLACGAAAFSIPTEE